MGSGFKSLVAHQPGAPGRGRAKDGDEKRESVERYSSPISNTIKSFGREVSSPHPSERHLMYPADGRIVQGLLPGTASPDAIPERQQRERGWFTAWNPPLSMLRLAFGSWSRNGHGAHPSPLR